jgi:Protein of unknown function (DUF3467)
MSEDSLSWADTDGAMPSARYVNGSRIDYTQWDMTFDFLLVTPADEIPEEAGAEPVYATERVARIIMSPMHAKALAARIGEAVEAWEKKFGRLPRSGAR